MICMRHKTPAQHLSAVLVSALTALLVMPAGAAESVDSAVSVDVGVPVLSPLVVTGSRVEHSSFDLPAAIDVVDRARITEGQARVNLSEALVAVPGITIQNRQNYAQDLQISSRGFGARSAFGVRGIKLIADGIPASMPDGQGQAATFNLDQAERIEVLRGPFSAIYGNHAGGVIQLFTREGEGAPSLETTLSGGSYGSWKADAAAQGKAGGVGYVLDASRFSTDGYRDHSAATRDQAMVKLSADLDPDSRLTLLANGLRQHDTQDPLGLTWAAFQSSPRSVAAVAESFNTRKRIDHVQGGATYQRRFGEDRLQISAYTGTRQVIQYQSISSVALPVNSRTSGGVVAFDRAFSGVGARWIAVRQLGSGSLTSTAGFDYERSVDDRLGYDNVNGVKGRLRRDERDTVSSFDPYVQTEWQSGRWGLSAGLRHSRLDFRVADHFNVGSANGDDSGRVSYRRTTPVLGVLYKAAPELNLYLSAAHGFEAPTFNEMFYSAAGGGFNFRLQPARSVHLEAGAKAIIGNDSRANLAVFQVRTQDELVVNDSTNGRTSYKNAGRTLRQGVELALDTAWHHDLTARLALSHLRAVYDETFSSGTPGVSVAAGNNIPGVAATTLFGELAWKHPASGFSAAVEGIYRSQIYVEDSNRQQAAPAYTLANLRFGFEQHRAGWKLKEFVRVDNLFDRSYVGSVIVGDGNQRYYESAPGRNWLAGVGARYGF
ncbi:MAG TPA: TonB-dependent receptor [Thiobacillus sp.]|nr:TonB-dependent receptor [Thiobacillus sp.]HQT69615.1 TonB-dependent receptor [Thiobacillus sp.]